MVEMGDAKKVAAALAGNLHGVSKDDKNFAGLPDSFWGYYARGHDSRGVFGVVVMYSEAGDDVDEVLRIYEQWLKERRRSAGVHE